ncbi:MAG: serine hydrolase, partial [Henriciella sp.]|nr:serine hydrolase [Henriciella sp.]
MFALPKHPAGIDWPTERWPEASQLSGFDDNALQALLDHAFTDPPPETLGETHALLAVHRGQVVAERYWRAFTASDTQPSWSMAKSITHALIGLLVRDGRIDIHAPADVPEWQGMGDLRKEITLDQLLRMSSGLKFTEDYVDAGVSDVIEMLFGEGKDDVGAFAASFPAEHAPGTAWSYSSGTTNIIARCAARALGESGEDFKAFMFRE